MSSNMAPKRKVSDDDDSDAEVVEVKKKAPAAKKPKKGDTEPFVDELGFNVQPPSLIYK